MKKSIRVLYPFLLSILLTQCIDQQRTILSPGKRLEYNRVFDQEQFSELTNSANKTTVLKSIRSMGRIQAPESRALLQSLLKQKESDVLAEAIFAAGQLPPDTSLEKKLIEIGMENPNEGIQMHVSRALGKIGTKRSETYLLSQLQKDNWKNRECAAIACALIFRRNKTILQKTIPEIFTLIQFGDSASWAGAYTLFQMGLPTHLEKIGQALKNSDANTQVYLLRAAYKMIQRLSDEKIQKEVDQKTYQYLVNVAKSKALWKQIEVTKNSGNWRVRREFAKLIGKVNPDEHLDDLINMTNDKQIHVRLAAYEGFRGIDASKKVNDIILDGIKNPDANISALNIANYAIRKKSMAFDSLKSWSRHGPISKRLAAVQGFAQLNSQEAYEYLLRLVKTGNRFIQIDAINAMSEFEIKQAADFKQALNSDNPPVVSISALTLAGMKDSTVIEELIQTFTRLNRETTIETAQDVLNSIIKIKPGMETNKFMLLADTAIPQTYHIIRRHLLKRGVEMTTIPFSSGLKIFYDKENELPLQAVIETNRGKMVLALFPNEAPQNVANFYHLAKKGFYNDLLFHRVVSDFVIQGGDPDSTGWGGPGYSIVDEYSPLPFERGSVGIATAGKDTGGCQFFICHSRQPHLDGRYTLFGKLIEGFDILDEIEQGDRIVDITTQRRN